MTKEEAIKMLRHCEAENHCDDGIHGNCKRCNQRIALDMAIEALQTDIVRCKDCKYIGKVGDLNVCRIHEISTRADDYCSRGERSEDLISRAEAIEAIELVDWYHQNKNKDMVHGANSDEHQAWYKAEDVYKALEAVPSADRPRGEWVEQEDDYHHYWECSECGMGVGLDDIRNFCPNCGSDNRERREE